MLFTIGCRVITSCIEHGGCLNFQTGTIVKIKDDQDDIDVEFSLGLVKPFIVRIASIHLQKTDKLIPFRMHGNNIFRRLHTQDDLRCEYPGCNEFERYAIIVSYGVEKGTDRIGLCDRHNRCKGHWIELSA